MHIDLKWSIALWIYILVGVYLLRMVKAMKAEDRDRLRGKILAGKVIYAAIAAAVLLYFLRTLNP